MATGELKGHTDIGLCCRRDVEVHYSCDLPSPASQVQAYTGRRRDCGRFRLHLPVGQIVIGLGHAEASWRRRATEARVRNPEMIG